MRLCHLHVYTLYATIMKLVINFRNVSFLALHYKNKTKQIHKLRYSISFLQLEKSHCVLQIEEEVIGWILNFM